MDMLDNCTDYEHSNLTIKVKIPCKVNVIEDISIFHDSFQAILAEESTAIVTI